MNGYIIFGGVLAVIIIGFLLARGAKTGGGACPYLRYTGQGPTTVAHCALKLIDPPYPTFCVQGRSDDYRSCHVYSDAESIKERVGQREFARKILRGGQ